MIQIRHAAAAAAAAKSLQSCPTLCNPIDSRPQGSSVPGILRQEYWSGLPLPSLQIRHRQKVKHWGWVDKKQSRVAAQ